MTWWLLTESVKKKHQHSRRFEARQAAFNLIDVVFPNQMIITTMEWALFSRWNAMHFVRWSNKIWPNAHRCKTILKGHLSERSLSCECLYNHIQKVQYLHLWYCKLGEGKVTTYVKCVRFHAASGSGIEPLVFLLRSKITATGITMHEYTCRECCAK